MFTRKSLLTLMFAGLLSTTAHAATFELDNGQTMQGEIISQDDQSYLIDMDGIEVRVPKDKVVSMDDGGEQAPANNTAAEATPAEAGAATAQSAQSSGSIELPIGTLLTVRMTEGVSSRQHQTGHTFTAVLEGDLVHGGEVIVPRGSNVYGELIEAEKSRRVAGKSSLSLQLTGVMINNQIQPIQTDILSDEGDNTLKDTAGKTGRAAAIGGLIDGGDGARTGAKVGVGAAILTGGSDIEVPQGSLIEFVLKQPLVM